MKKENSATKIALSREEKITSVVTLDWDAVREFLLSAGEDNEELDAAMEYGRTDLIYDGLMKACRDSHENLDDVLDRNNMIYCSQVTGHELEFNI